jgi:hypothetical protein
MVENVMMKAPVMVGKNLVDLGTTHAKTAQVVVVVGYMILIQIQPVGTQVFRVVLAICIRIFPKEVALRGFLMPVTCNNVIVTQTVYIMSVGKPPDAKVANYASMTVVLTFGFVGQV